MKGTRSAAVQRSAGGQWGCLTLTKSPAPTANMAAHQPRPHLAPRRLLGASEVVGCGQVVASRSRRLLLLQRWRLDDRLLVANRGD